MNLEGCRIYKRKDPIHPWGYYIPPKFGTRGVKGEIGHFVCDSKEEASRQVKRRIAALL